MLVYIIPQTRLNRGIARLLASRFEKIQVFRFPDPEYDDFKQVVVFGVRKTGNSLDEGLALKLQKHSEPQAEAIAGDCCGTVSGSSISAR